MSDIELTTLDIRGEKVPVRVSDTGLFSADIGLSHRSDETLDGLRSKLMTVSRKQAAKVDVPFTKLVRNSYGGDRYRYTLRSGTATGIHAGTGNVIVRWQDGTTEQDNGYSVAEDNFRPLSSEERDELLRLLAARDAAAKALREFKKNRTISSLVGAVREAVDKAAMEQAEQESS